jgi:MFS transporter, OCT family, solute carrier family 22 (organic cation transporter), member 18
LVDKLVKGSKEESTAAYGRLKSIAAFGQALGSLVVGSVIDRFGIKAGFILSFLSSAVYYFLLCNTDSMEMLYVSKLPTLGIGAFLCAQCAIAKVTAQGPERIAALGRITTSYTIGGVIGPYLGGIIGSTGDYFVGARYA